MNVLRVRESAIMSYAVRMTLSCVDSIVMASYFVSLALNIFLCTYGSCHKMRMITSPAVSILRFLLHCAFRVSKSV
jgi:hypothetical protein